MLIPSDAPIVGTLPPAPGHTTPDSLLPCSDDLEAEAPDWNDFIPSYVAGRWIPSHMPLQPMGSNSPKDISAILQPPLRPLTTVQETSEQLSPPAYDEHVTSALHVALPPCTSRSSSIAPKPSDVNEGVSGELELSESTVVETETNPGVYAPDSHRFGASGASEGPQSSYSTLDEFATSGLCTSARPTHLSTRREGDRLPPPSSTSHATEAVVAQSIGKREEGDTATGDCSSTGESKCESRDGGLDVFDISSPVPSTEGKIKMVSFPSSRKVSHRRAASLPAINWRIDAGDVDVASGWETAVRRRDASQSHLQPRERSVTEIYPLFEDETDDIGAGVESGGTTAVGSPVLTLGRAKAPSLSLSNETERLYTALGYLVPPLPPHEHERRRALHK